MRRLINSVLLIAAMIPLSLHAQDSTSLSLEDALKYAERNQVKIKNALLDQKSSLARNKEVTGMALPQINAKGGVTYAPLIAQLQMPNFLKAGVAQFVDEDAWNDEAFENSPNTLGFAFQPRWTTTSSIEANQILFDPAMMVALQARKSLEELAAKGVAVTIQDVKVAVTKAYYNLLIAEKQKTLVDQNIVRLQQMEFEMQQMYENGFVEKIDVDRITVALNNLQTQKIRVDQMIGLAYLSLKFQMGMPLEQPITLTDSISDSFTATDLLTRELDVRNRNEFQLLQIQNDLYAYDLKRYKLGWLPTITAFGNYGYTLYNMERLFQGGDQWQKTALVGGNINIPLFTGFQRKYKVQQAQFTLEKNQNDIQNLRQALTLEKENARITLRNNVLALENQRKNMQLAETIYNTSRIKYKEGVGSSLEVMDAESALKEAQTNYFTALYDVMTARVDLEKALGLFNN